MDVVLRDVLSGEDHRGVLPLLAQKPERIAHRFEHRLGAQVGTTDADADDQIGLGAELGCGGFDGREIGAGDRRREVHPPQKVVARTLARVEQCVGGLCLGLHVGRNLDAGFADVESQSIHIVSD